ncbi:MAG: HNH endonuclease [Rhizobiaceae bacterium]|nr:HNH endonuclease [Rhizobiaceae bacterium]
MSKNPKSFLGHSMTRADVRALASLLARTTNAVGLIKRKIKTESEMWAVVQDMYGHAPYPGEDFMVAVRRINDAIGTKPLVERQSVWKKAKEKSGRSPASKRPKKAKAKKSGKAGSYIAMRDEFYLSWEWRRLRMEVLKEYGRRCMCCGAVPSDKAMHGARVRIVVDHIKPLAKFWELRLDRTNLQVLCDECNKGKGAWDQTDHREPIGREELDALTAEYMAIMGPAANARPA